MSNNPTKRKLDSTIRVLSQLAKVAEVAAARSTVARMPAIFIGHGSPMNAIADNAFTQMLGAWGKKVGTPTAIVAVSAHWQTPGVTLVDVQAHPRTIHDFYQFPPELYQVQYPVSGAPDIAQQIIAAAQYRPIQADTQWGIDHGTWSVLRHMFPLADVPVFQLSIDYDAVGEVHYAIGRELQALREQGVLVAGSGNIVHNLRRIDFGAQEDVTSTQSWAQEFDRLVKTALLQRDDQALMRYADFGSSAALAVPTPDHYWPLLYTLGAAHGEEPVQFTYETFQAGTLSMRCVQFGGQ